jgi:sucrose phosphorylase
MLKQVLKDKIATRLRFIYDEKITDSYLDSIYNLIENNLSGKEQSGSKWNEQDIILISYGDSIKRKMASPLQSLNQFLLDNVEEEISIVHILPFYPFSSDDGFSVVDYEEVNPDLGDWKDIEEIGKNYDLMVDMVINHISQHSEWFENYLGGKEPGKDFFIEADPSKDYAKVVRPRSLPLLTSFNTSRGERHIWTTFSEDQVDLDFSNPEVFYEMLKVLLLYINKGARIVRLDAIAFLWKEENTSCFHLPQTHEIVKLFRDIAEAVDPGTIILTETNVPNEENLSYFGTGDEAHMVYQFSLPPLLLHALFFGESKYLVQWAKTIPELQQDCTFFNFTASHDGIGVRPLEGLLPNDELVKLVEGMKANGGLISTRRKPDGSDSPYELNITYFDALKQTKSGSDDFHVDRFLCSQMIMMGMKGIPAIYIHSLLATENYHEGVRETGRSRTINRKKWDHEELLDIISEDTPQASVFYSMKRLMWIRKHQKAFHPDGRQGIVELGNFFFAFRREYKKQVIYSISNITNKEQYLEFSEIKEIQNGNWIDLLSGAQMLEPKSILFDPYRTIWLLMD